MYNRYIGNTGKYYRVEDADDISKALESEPAPEPEIPPTQPEMAKGDSERGERSDLEEPPSPPPRQESSKMSDRKKKPSIEPGKIAELPGSLRGLIKKYIPEGLDLGDILLVLVLLFLFLENDDDEMLIVLIILIFMWVKPLLIKGDE